MYKPSRRSTRNKIPKGWKYAITFLLVYFAVSFLASAYDLWKLNHEAQKVHDSLIKLELKNNELKKKIAMVQSEEYIEKVAREELGLVKKDETLIITTGDAKKPGVWKVTTDPSNTKKVTD